MLDNGSSVAGPGVLWTPQSITDFRQIIAAEPGRATIVNDPLRQKGKVLRVECQNEDITPKTPTGDPRCQLLSPGLMVNEWEINVHIGIMVPASVPPIIAGKFFQLMEIMAPPFEGSAVWSLALNHEEGVECFQWQRNGTYEFDIPMQRFGHPLVRNHWYDVWLRIYMSAEIPETAGWVEMWIGGEQITFFNGESYNPKGHEKSTKLVMKTIDASNNKGNSAFYFGNYRAHNTEGMLGDVTLYYTLPKIGTTKTSVA